MAKKPPVAPVPPPIPSSAHVIATVLAKTQADVAAKKAARAAQAAKKVAAGKKVKPFNEKLTFSIQFAKHFGEAVVDAVRHEFPEIVSGEIPSHGERGPKRLDVRYSTPEMGLGFGISFKSVHVGEQNGGNADFVHNMKRNDEELRVEGTGHHLRQRYAVLAAVLFLPLEAAQDALPTEAGATSSFAQWVQYLWPLKGREEPEDPPDLFELVFVALYARNGTQLGFYEVGGPLRCPRLGPPSGLLTSEEFLQRIRAVFIARNSRDFYFEGEGPP